MDDITRAEPSAPMPENYEGRLAPDQRQSFEKALTRQYTNVWLSPFIVFLYVTIWQAIRLWRGHIDSAWLLLVSLNIVPLLLVSLIGLWIERKQRPRVPRMNRMRRELREGAVAQSEGELVWHEHAYTPVLSERGLFALDTTIRDLLPGQYRLFYLPETGLLVAAERLGEPLLHRDLLLTLAHAQGFSAATLAANRVGETGPARQGDRRETIQMLILLLVFVPFGVLLAVVASIRAIYPDQSTYLPPGYSDYVASPAEPLSLANAVVAVALIALVLAVPMVIALLALRGRRIPKLNLSGLLEKPRVLAVEGMARKSVRDADYLPVYTIEAGGRQFTIQKATYLALDTSIPYRVYYLPRGNRLQSMEPLASEAVPAAV